MQEKLIKTFVQVFASLAGKAHVAENAAEAAEIIACILAESQAPRVALAGLPPALEAPLLDYCAEHDITAATEPYPANELPGAIDAAAAGISSAAFAIAETGTLVEIATNDAQRLVSALPNTHIGVVQAGQLVPTLLSAAPRLRNAFARHDKNVAVSFLSGPSRTGDIELKLTLGVHGPAVAHAILVRAPMGGSDA